jgi:FxsC-like protein
MLPVGFDLYTLREAAPFAADWRQQRHARVGGRVLYFFLSYARGDDDVYVERFFQDLCTEVRVLTGARRDEKVGFFDNDSMELGTEWPQALATALATCQSFLALYSPAYFLSEPCGKEWSIFRERARQYEHEAGVATSALIPLLWVTPPQLPPAAQTLQYTNHSLGSAYNNGGLRQLLRLQRNRDAYLEFVSALAARIVESAHRHAVPELIEVPDFDAVPSAFHDTPVPVPAQASPSQVVHFVVAATTRSEAQSLRTDTRYYGDRPQDWAPYRPGHDSPICEYATRVAARSRFQAAVATIDELDDRIMEARRHNQIVVLLVDAWSTKVDRHWRKLREYDQRNEPTTAVLIPWSHEDDETSLNVQLAELVRQTFLNNSLRRDDVMFRPSVLSHEAFVADLPIVLEVARNRVFTRGTVYRRPPEPPGQRPILEGP